MNKAHFVSNLTLLFLKRVRSLCHFFLRRTLRFGSCGYFSAFSPMAFSLFSRFLRRFGFVFLSPGRRCLAEVYLFTDLTTLAPFLPASPFFAFSRRFTDVARCASLEIRLK
ncbi:hypothetical protein ACNKHX_26640 [Shigella flexneri]